MSENRVIFSSIDYPENTVVQESLLRVGTDLKSIVITSRKYQPHWARQNIDTHIATFNSTSTSRRYLRKILVRSKLLCKAINWLLFRRDLSYSHFLMPPHTARHFEYRKILSKMNEDAWAILVDSRDLIFQEDPNFIIDGLQDSPGVHLFLEDKYFFKNGVEQLNNLSPANWNWALQVKNLDHQAIEFLANTEIINAGCIIGRVRELRVFFDKTCNLLANSRFNSYALLDQAAVNLVGYGLSDDLAIKIHKNGEIALNMCGVIDKQVEIEKGILFADKKIISVVHQFDRFGHWNRKTGLTFDRRKYEIQEN